MNEFTSEPSEGAASSLLAHKSHLERVNTFLQYHHAELLTLFKRFQQVLDQVTPFAPYRWAATVVLLILFLLRVVYAEGWYIIT